LKAEEFVNIIINKSIALSENIGWQYISCVIISDNKGLSWRKKEEKQNRQN
jgi:hypothetical protein